MPGESFLSRQLMEFVVRRALVHVDSRIVGSAPSQILTSSRAPDALADLLEALRGTSSAARGVEMRPVLQLTAEDTDLPGAPVTPADRYELVRKERDELFIQNEILKSRVAEERRTAARAQQQYDQLKPSVDKMIDDLRDRGRANQTLQGALIAHHTGRVCMHESYNGVVEGVHADKIVVVYETDDDLLEQVYDRSQFIDGKLPSVGDAVQVFVHLALRSPGERDATVEEEATEAPRKRRNVITDSWHEF